MGFFSAKSLAGPGYIILNILRVCNIITLLAIAAAAVVLLAKIHLASNVGILLSHHKRVNAFANSTDSSGSSRPSPMSSHFS